MASLPKPLGPFSVSFADFELKRGQPLDILASDLFKNAPSSAGSSSSSVTASIEVSELNVPRIFKEGMLPPPPLFRVYYPLQDKPPRFQTPRQFFARKWCPTIRYTYGYLCSIIQASSWYKKVILWTLAAVIQALTLPGMVIAATVGGIPFAGRGGGLNPNGRMPVVLVSHGLWAMRATMSALCCDLASHGYVVVAVEHLDGSACMASYTGYDGSTKWMPHATLAWPFVKVSDEVRHRQLQQRAEEMRGVLDVLEALDQGLLSDSANAVRGVARLDMKWLFGRLDLDRVVVAGHSFGGATAILTAGIDPRPKACIVLDAWFEPFEEDDLERAAGGLPLLSMNAPTFKWARQDQLRKRFFEARLALGNARGSPLTTQCFSLKNAVHQTFADVGLILPAAIAKRLRFGGGQASSKLKDVNSRACLRFLYQNLQPPAAAYKVDFKEGDADYLIAGSPGGDF